MKLEPKKLWLEALRSGDYKQGKGYLRTNEGHCCLGVLCEVAIANGVPVTREEEQGYHYYDSDCAMPPAEVMEWAGLDVGNPTVLDRDNPNFETTLATMNDSGASFEKIAAVIEEQL